MLCGGHEVKFLKKPSSGENVSFSVKRQNFQGSLETPMEICYLSSDEEKDGSTSEKEVFEERTPLTQDDGNANPEEIVGDTQSQIQNILGKFEGDINKTLHVKRKHMETYIKDSFKRSNQKLEQVWKMNKRERKKINSKFCKQYITTFQKFDMDVQKFNEEQEKSANNYQKQQKAFKLSKSSQNQSLQAVREVHEKFMKGLMDLETNNHDMLFGIDGELRKEMSMFKKNLMKQTLKFSSAFETSD
uniref:RIKEN cDNA 3830403N18 gene like n=1 Tax=Rattus norvegicus TaxID=10116 RepID=A0ABK0L9H6_RAT|nr:X-linked lymphocyte-regulated protein PM1 isoform X2 [Rattus norvegicus]